MSSALVRQALELVDPEENVGAKRGGRKLARQRLAGQDHRHLFKSKNKRPKEPTKSKEAVTEENIKKLLALSAQTVDAAVAEKIVERAVKRKPLANKIEIKKDEEKSILFPEGESFGDFERQLFCS